MRRKDEKNKSLIRKNCKKAEGLLCMIQQKLFNVAKFIIETKSALTTCSLIVSHSESYPKLCSLVKNIKHHCQNQRTETRNKENLH